MANSSNSTWWCSARQLLGLGMLGVLLLASPVEGAKVSYSDYAIEVSLDVEPRGNPSHGYTEYRIQVINRGSERTRQVTLMFPGNTISGRGGATGIRSISRTVEVGPGRASMVSLFQPIQPDVPGNGLVVYIDGRKQDDQVPMTPVSSIGGHSVYYGRRRFPTIHHYGIMGGGSN